MDNQNIFEAEGIEVVDDMEIMDLDMANCEVQEEGKKSKKVGILIGVGIGVIGAGVGAVYYVKNKKEKAAEKDAKLAYYMEQYGDIQLPEEMTAEELADEVEKKCKVEHKADKPAKKKSKKHK